MLIDWFTVGAQALNFIILIWLLRRFLYTPILKAIDDREKLISTKLADAEAATVEAQKENEEFRRKNLEFDGQRAVLLDEATDKAKAECLRLVDATRKSNATLAAQQREALRNEKLALLQDFGRQTRQEVFAIARKALQDLAGTDLEERLIEVFTHRLQAMDEHGRAMFTSALSAHTPMLVRSTFELSLKQRAALQATLSETFTPATHILFETAPDLFGGIELIANGQKVVWSIADYLAALETSIDTFLNNQEATALGATVRPLVPATEVRVDEYPA